MISSGRPFHPAVEDLGVELAGVVQEARGSQLPEANFGADLQPARQAAVKDAQEGAQAVEGVVQGQVDGPGAQADAACLDLLVFPQRALLFFRV